MQKQRVVTPGYKMTHGPALVRVSIHMRFFCRLLEVDDGFSLEA